MRTREEIEAVLDELPTMGETKYAAMTYEGGIQEALEWVLGEIKDELYTIPGGVPNLIGLPPGCRFAPRCRARVEQGLEVCTREIPPLKTIAPGHQVRCWLYD